MENLSVPPNLEALSGRARVDAVRALLDQAGVHGEIGFIRHFPKQRRLSIPVSVPGRETTLDLDIGTRVRSDSACRRRRRSPGSPANWLRDGDGHGDEFAVQRNETGTNPGEQPLPCALPEHQSA
jgi:hypothetical protein